MTLDARFACSPRAVVLVSSVAAVAASLYHGSVVLLALVLGAVPFALLVHWKSTLLKSTDAQVAPDEHPAGQLPSSALYGNKIYERVVQRCADFTKQLHRLSSGGECPPGPDDLEIVRFLGQGSMGSAYACITTSNKLLVMKQVPLQRARTVKEVDQIMDEVSNTLRLNHPHIVRLRSAYVTGGSGPTSPPMLHIILEHADGGTLCARISELQDRQHTGGAAYRFATRLVEVWLAQLCSAVAHMHSKKATPPRQTPPCAVHVLVQRHGTTPVLVSCQVLHRDLSSPNIFHRANGDILVGDLGGSKKVGQSSMSMQGGGRDDRSLTPRTMIGTPQYLSPELLSGEPYGLAADAWAVGVLLFEMLSLERPFDSQNLASTVLLVTSGRPTPAASAALVRSAHPKGLCKLASAEGLLHTDPRLRMSVGTVLGRFPLPADDSWRKLLCEPELLPEDAQVPFVPLRMAGALPNSVAPLSPADAATSAPGTASRENSLSQACTQMLGARGEVLSCAASMMDMDTADTSFVDHRSQGTAVPQECPTLPPHFEPRQDVFTQLLGRLTDMSASGLASATALVGMGGAGKSVLAAALLRDLARRAEFDRVCWVSVGQSPDLRYLLTCMHKQLMQTEASDESKSSLEAISERVAQATRGHMVVVVLDDVWDVAHAKTLGAPLETSSLLITTRVASLLPGIHDVACGLLSESAALKLLLHCGGVDVLHGAGPREAALEVVALCGCLPLAIALAGALMQEYADVWEAQLVPLLRSANQAALRCDDTEASDHVPTVEERLVTSSLTLLRSRGHNVAIVLFHLWAVFAEDATVHASVFDALEPILCERVRADRDARDAFAPVERVGTAVDSQQVRPRRALSVLLKFSLVQGSIKDGMQMHDLAHAYVRAHAPSTSQMQREILTALCGALGQPAPPASLVSYAQAQLQHHVAAALQSPSGARCPTPLHWNDPVLELAVTQPIEWVQRAFSFGVGSAVMRATAHAAASEERWLRAGQLWMLLAGIAEEQHDEGSCLMQARQALSRVEPIDDVSVRLEATVLRGLILKKGTKINSPEYVAVNRRLEDLLVSEPGRRCATLAEAYKVTRGAVYFAQLHVASALHRPEGMLEVYRSLLPMAGVVFAAKKLGAPDEATRAIAPLNQVTLNSTWLHDAAGYSWEIDFGPDGAWLRALVTWYDRSSHHVTFKSTTGRDVTGTGLGGALLLARWGDAAGADIDWSSSIPHWAQLCGDVQAGKVEMGWRKYRVDVLDARTARALALAAGRYTEASRLFDCSPEGAFFAATAQMAAAAGDVERSAARRHEEMAMAELAGHVQALNDYMDDWGMQCTWTQPSFVLMARAVGTMLLPDGESLSAEADPLRWLPPPDALLELAAAERAWDVWPVGAQHPALACAMLYARRGRWADAGEIARGLLGVLRQRVTRFEARRLIARCDIATGAIDAARASLLAAAEEAASPGYLHLEALARRELASLTPRLSDSRMVDS